MLILRPLLFKSLHVNKLKLDELIYRIRDDDVRAVVNLLVPEVTVSYQHWIGHFLEVDYQFLLLLKFLLYFGGNGIWLGPHGDG